MHPHFWRSDRLAATGPAQTATVTILSPVISRALPMRPLTDTTNTNVGPCGRSTPSPSDRGRIHSPWTAARCKKKSREEVQHAGNKVPGAWTPCSPQTGRDASLVMGRACLCRAWQAAGQSRAWHMLLMLRPMLFACSSARMRLMLWGNGAALPSKPPLNNLLPLRCARPAGSDNPPSWHEGELIALQLGAVRLQTPGSTPGSSAHSSPAVDRAEGEVHPAKAYIVDQQVGSLPVGREWVHTRTAVLGSGA